LRLGTVIANQVPWAGSDAILRLARATEEAGLDSVWVADHVVMPAAFTSAYPVRSLQDFSPEENETFFEPLVTLAFVASRTSRVRLGTSILVPTLRHPAYTAKLVATLDNLSGGRVVLGVGAGWLREEFDALGVKRFEDRGTLLDEHVAVLRALWSSEVASFEGVHYRLPPVRCAPKPARAAGPPIWIGGSSSAALRRVAAIGDGWQPMAVGPAELAVAVPRLRELVRNAGRDPDAIDICPRCDLAFGRTDVRKANGIYGGPDEVAAGLAAYRDAGCTELILDLQPDDSLAGRLETLAQLTPLVR
jgi:probable F420-dependent oxidoreductase